MEADTQVLRFRSHDPKEHSDVLRPWDLQINQVSPGKFLGTVDAIATPSMLMYEERWSQRTVVRGSTPPGYVMIGIAPGWRRSQTNWCGSSIGFSTIAVGRPAGEMQVVAPRNSHHAVVLVQPQTLAQGLGAEWLDRICSGWSLDVEEDSGDLLWNRVLAAVRRFSERPELLSRGDVARSLESTIMETLIRCAESRGRGHPHVGTFRRARALRSALDFAAARQGRTTALELSTAAGVSQRTLEYAFRNALGTTPGRYLRVLRLNEVRRDLLEADPRAAYVGQIAIRRGFYHQGRFATGYREQFGELPSRTLRCRPSVHPVLKELTPGDLASVA